MKEWAKFSTPSDRIAARLVTALQEEIEFSRPLPPFNFETAKMVEAEPALQLALVVYREPTLALAVIKELDKTIVPLLESPTGAQVAAVRRLITKENWEAAKVKIAELRQMYPQSRHVVELQRTLQTASA